MKILVVGSGGREHTLSWKLKQSTRVDKVYCAPGNAGIEDVAELVDIEVNDLDGLLDFALKEKIDLTIIGPEEPLVMGIVDLFEENGLKVFGANEKAAQLEGSKEFSKEFMLRHDLATANYSSHTDYESAVAALEDFDYPVVIKADGLCAGKGVIICEDRKMAVDTLDEILNEDKFGSQGNKVVMEEFLDGIEASLLCFVSGSKIYPMESAKDYKQIYDGDKGPNTGGIGCYSPSPLFTKELNSSIDRQIEKIELGLGKDGLEFTGILFIGFMIVDGEPKILEFNVRFGDPETEVVVPRLETDLLDIFEKSLDNSLEQEDLVWSDKSCLTVVATSKNYPDTPDIGYEITFEGNIDEEIMIFHNGTRLEDGKLYNNGGRVLSITALGDTIEDAREKIYANMDKINFKGMYYRKDIGKF